MQPFLQTIIPTKSMTYKPNKINHLHYLVNIRDFLLFKMSATVAIPLLAIGEMHSIFFRLRPLLPSMDSKFAPPTGNQECLLF